MNLKSSLTSLRFLAAYMVVGSHYFSFSGPLTYLTEIFKRGHLGVEFFFILSGFVLGLRYHDEIIDHNFKKMRFFLLRMARIAPAYYLSFLLASVALYKAIPVLEFHSISFNTWMFILSNLTFSQSFIPVTSLIEGWNLPSWSLSVEFIYYLLFPFLSVHFIRTKFENRWLFILFGLSVIIFSVSSFLPEFINFLGFSTRITWTNSPLARLPQFLIGQLLAKKFLRNEGLSFATPALWVSTIACLVLFIFPLPHFMIAMGSPLPILVFSTLIYFVALTDREDRILNNRILVYLGEASYALYIFQVPLKMLFQQIFSKVLKFGDTHGVFYCSYLSVCLILSSAILYSFFELPINKFFRKKINQMENS